MCLCPVSRFTPGRGRMQCAPTKGGLRSTSLFMAMTDSLGWDLSALAAFAAFWRKA